MADAVSMQGVSRSFGAHRALDDLSFAIPAGVFAAIVGPSGCGKTTLLRVIAGLTRPDAGELRIGGAIFAPEVRPELRGISMMFQSPTLFPYMTVFENVAFPLRVRNKSEREIRHSVERFLRLANLGDSEGAKPAELSGGQQQRVALCRALVFEPAVLLLDEPLSALDRPLRESLQRELHTMQRLTGATFVIVTHDRGEAMVLSDLVLVMNGGRIEQSGSPREVYASPASRFVAEFFSSSAIVGGEVVQNGGRWTVLSESGMTLHLSRRPIDAARVDVAIRPEQVRPGGTATAVVEETRFAGAMQIVTLRAGADRLVMHTEVAYREGEIVNVSIDADATLYYQQRRSL